MKKARVAVVGASGYTGGELLRLLASHPHVEIAFVTADKHAGKRVDDIFPSLRGPVGDRLLERVSDAKAADSADFAFTALPHHASATTTAELLSAGLPVVDLSADFRFEQLPVYEAWYGEHPRPDLLGAAVFGLPELHRERIRGAKLVGNPGCYVTSAILALAPLLEAGLVEPADIIVDAKSGVSGAGRSPSDETLFTEVNEGFRPYKVAAHRHQPEIEKELAALASGEVRITFVPHLLPINRGILSSVYCRPKGAFSLAAAREAFAAFYAGEPFVRLLAEGRFPNPGHVRGSNYCDIGLHFDERHERLIVFSAIDNLGKGAAGQAVQNMNLMLGFDETTALTGLPIFP